MDGFNMLLPLEKFLPTSVERPDILEVLYQETEIVSSLGTEEFNKIPLQKEYIDNEKEREQRKIEYAKQAEERAERLRAIEKETGKSPLVIESEHLQLEME
jgi:hypothetical protein